MTKPFINENILNRIFGEKADRVKETFVQHCHDDIYEMRSEFDTQRKVEAYFAERKDEESRNICERAVYTNQQCNFSYLTVNTFHVPSTHRRAERFHL